MRVEATIKNSIWGIIYHIVYVLLGFLSRLIFVRILGVEYYGVNGLFVSVLTILSVADLGIGWAMAYNLYEPLAKQDKPVVAGLMHLFEKCYFVIAIFIMLLGFAIAPFIGYFVHTTFLPSFVKVIFLIVVFENAVSFLFSHKTILLTADQKNYVSTIFETLINLFQLSVRIIFLIITRDYITYLVSGIVIRIIGNWLRSNYVDKQYPYLRNREYFTLDSVKRNKVFRDAKSIFVNKVCTTSVGAVNNLFIAWCGGSLGVIKVGYYSNYQLIINVVIGLAGQFTNSYQASLGNLYVTDGKERAYDVFKKSTFVSFWIATFGMCCLVGLIHPFVAFWMGKDFTIVDYSIEVAILNFGLVILFDPLNRVVNAAGLFKRDKYHALTEAVLNIVCSITFMNLWGMIGIFIGATVGIVVSSVMRGQYVMVDYFEKNSRAYFMQILKYSAISSVSLGMTWYICSIGAGFTGIVPFLLRAMVCVILPNVICYGLLHRTDEFEYMKELYVKFLNSLVAKLK